MQSIMIMQVCDHPYLLPGVDPMDTDERLVSASSKLLLLDRLLVRLRAAGRRALIYSQFTSMLDVLADYLAFRGHRFPYTQLSLRISAQTAALSCGQGCPRLYVTCFGCWQVLAPRRRDSACTKAVHFQPSFTQRLSIRHLHDDSCVTLATSLIHQIM